MTDNNLDGINATLVRDKAVERYCETELANTGKCPMNYKSESEQEEESEDRDHLIIGFG